MGIGSDMIIYPYDLSQITIDELLQQNLIIPSLNQKLWHATIFNKSKNIQQINYYDKNRIITLIDDILFNGFQLLNTQNQIVMVNNNKGKKNIKSIEIGDFNNSIKRYTNLDKPIDYNNDAYSFLNLPKIDITLNNQLDVVIPKNELYFKPIVSTLPQIKNVANERSSGLFQQTINHPFINTPISQAVILKNNNKAIIESIFIWAKTQNIKYIYSINEYRPYIMSLDYVTPYVYYTITGSY